MGPGAGGPPQAIWSRHRPAAIIRRLTVCPLPSDPRGTAMSSFLITLGEIERRYHELDHLMAEPSVASDPARIAELGKERAEIEPVVDAFRRYAETERQLDDAQ